MKSFKQMWDLAKNLGTDTEERIKILYDEMVLAKIPEPVIESFIELFYEINALQKYVDENKADINDLETLEKRVGRHKHLLNGDCVEAF